MRPTAQKTADHMFLVVLEGELRLGRYIFKRVHDAKKHPFFQSTLDPCK